MKFNINKDNAKIVITCLNHGLEKMSELYTKDELKIIEEIIFQLSVSFNN